jgi:hypothetical protein
LEAVPPLLLYAESGECHLAEAIFYLLRALCIGGMFWVVIITLTVFAGVERAGVWNEESRIICNVKHH